MPPVLRVGVSFPADPFGVQLTDSIKDDLVDLFTGDECEDIFRNVDFSAIDIEDVDVSVFSSYDSDDDIEAEFLDAKRYMEVKNHDCMWGGQCCNKEFFRTQPPPPPPPVRAPPPVRPAPQQPVLITHSSQNKVVTIQKCIQKCSGSDRTESQQVVVVTNTNKVPVRSEGRSLLLNRTTHTQPPPPVKVQTPSPVKIKREFLTPQNSRPETPQSLSGSDEEDYVPIPLDSHNTTTIRSVLDAFTSSSSSSSSCDWDEEFSVLGRSRDDKSAVVRNMTVATTDHSYVQGVPSKSVKLENLGVDTPSDSEEEIDVVSLSERSSSSRSSSCGGLPTRPTLRDQEHLEEITTSLLSASEAVSRKLKKTITHKRKKYESESSEDDDDTEGPDHDQDQEDDDDRDEDMEERIARYTMTKLAHRQTKRQKQSPSKVRRKKVPRFTGEEDDLMRRDMHNNMERMRRIDLRNAFEELKAIVPAVASKDRAAKVVILREAAQYCDELGAESRSKYMQVMALRKEQQRLHNIVRSLRRAAAQAVKTPRPYY